MREKIKSTERDNKILLKGGFYLLSRVSKRVAVIKTVVAISTATSINVSEIIPLLPVVIPFFISDSLTKNSNSYRSFLFI